jgi:adenylyl-sulfate kinase
MTQSSNTTWHPSTITTEERTKYLGHGAVLWFTGLSGSGKSTVARAVEEYLVQKGVNAFVLDGDNLRHGLNKDLGFSAKDRQENVRRVGEVCSLFATANVIVLAAFISPFRAGRDAIREKMQPRSFLEIHISTSLQNCQSRDPKGLYKRALAGEISDFTGISSPYEAPLNPELRLDTAGKSLDACVREVVALLQASHIIPVE